MASIAERAAEIMEHLCTHSAHGYSQPNRAGIGTGGGAGETLTLSDGTQVSISTGDRDCSSAAIECYAAQGINCGGATYTGNMKSCMTASGNFQALPASTWRTPQRGDILLNSGNHTAVALGNGKLGEFLRSENHSTHGTLGDQDGEESVIRALYDDSWDCVLRYCGAEPTTNVSEDDMTECFITIPKSDNMAAGIIVYVCGDRVHDIANTEALKYLNSVYKAVHGHDMPSFQMSGSKAFPAFQRMLQAIRGGIPDPSIFPYVDMFGARSAKRADGCTGTE